MKISRIESGKATGAGATEGKILPESRPKGSMLSRPEQSRQLSPLEKGMLVAEQALTDVPDVREALVQEIKEKIRKGEYKVNGAEVAEMMLRRLAADNVR